MRLCTTNWRSNSAIAGPDHAIHPSLARNLRCCSRGSSASRSCSCRRKSRRPLMVLTGSSIWNPSRADHAGIENRLKT
ncbi:Uncharacterised protein [Mycobacteroides abscessus subsp. abscessus]|nr:Uncharacterised protein [Mycobacteroides abscessus subsp. abscessus]